MNKVELLYPIENTFRHHMPLDGMWFFAFSHERLGGSEKGLSNGNTIPVPANFSNVFIGREKRNYIGDVWYEKNVFLPKSWLGQEVFLRLDGVAHRCTVYVNGMEVGRFVQTHVPTVVEVTRHMQYGDTNKITIKVNNLVDDSTVSTTKMHPLHDDKSKTGKMIPVGGIIKSVHLYAVPATRITDYQVSTLQATPEQATIHYAVQVVGNCLVTATLRNRKGKVVATAVGGNATLTVDMPHLWTIGDGYLYTLDFEISRLGKQSDAYSTSFGIRTFTFTNNKLLLNNNPVYLKGYYYPYRFNSYGVDDNRNLIEARRVFSVMEEMGANCLWVDGGLISEEILAMADAMGVLVMEAVPLAVQTGLDRVVMERDKNHTSVIGWALLNSMTYENNTFPYEEILEEQMHKKESFSRLYAVTVPYDQEAKSSLILERAQIILLTGLSTGYTSPNGVQDGVMRSLADIVRQEILTIQNKYPHAAIIPVFDGTSHSGMAQAKDDVYSLAEEYKGFFAGVEGAKAARGCMVISDYDEMPLIVKNHWGE